MSKQYDETDTGALFLNHNKNKKKSPNLVGKVNIDGTEYWLSGWTKEIQKGDREGEKMISLSVGDEIKYERKKRKKRDKREPGDDHEEDELEDDIPF